MSVEVTISLWWLLWLYCAGALFWAVVIVKDRPWQINGRGMKPYDGWQYKTWGIPIAWTINVVAWPVPVARNLLDPYMSRRRSHKRAENWRAEFGDSDV